MVVKTETSFTTSSWSNKMFFYNSQVVKKKKKNKERSAGNLVIAKQESLCRIFKVCFTFRAFRLWKTCTVLNLDNATCDQKPRTNMKHRAVCTFLSDSRSFHRSRMTFDIFTEYKEVESKVKHRLIKTRIAAEPTHYICFNTLEINVKPSRGFWEKW